MFYQDQNKSVGERIKDMSWFCTTYLFTPTPIKSFILDFFNIIEEISDLLENSDQNLEIDIRHFDIIVQKIERMIRVSEYSENPDQLPTDSREKIQKAKNFRSRFTPPITKKDQDTDDQPETSSSSQSSSQSSDSDDDSNSAIKSAEDQDVKDRLQEFLDNLEEPLSNEEREKFIKMDEAISQCGAKHNLCLEAMRIFVNLNLLFTDGPMRNACFKYSNSICTVNKFFSQSKRRKKKHKSSRDCSY